MWADPTTWALYAEIASESLKGYRGFIPAELLPVPSAGREARAQMRRYRRDQGHRLLGLRDRHHDLARMQLQSGRIGARHELDLARAALARLVAVDVIAENRKAFCRTMHAQLMRAPGDGLEREPGNRAL